MTIRFGVKFKSDAGMIVRAVEEGRVVAELEFILTELDDIEDVWADLVNEGNSINDTYGPGAGDDHLVEAARIERCAEAYNKLEVLAGRLIPDIMILQYDESDQLDLAELGRMWRIAVIAAGRQAAAIWAPQCTWVIFGSPAEPRLGKAWKLPQFRSGVWVAGPTAFMQPALPAAAANPKPKAKRRVVGGPDAIGDVGIAPITKPFKDEPANWEGRLRLRVFGPHRTGRGRSQDEAALRAKIRETLEEQSLALVRAPKIHEMIGGYAMAEAIAEPKGKKKAKTKRPKAFEPGQLTRRQIDQLIKAGAIPRVTLERQVVERQRWTPPGAGTPERETHQVTQWVSPPFRTRRRSYSRGAIVGDVRYVVERLPSSASVPPPHGKHFRATATTVSGPLPDLLTPEQRRVRSSEPVRPAARTLEGIVQSIESHAATRPGLGAPGKKALKVCSAEACHAWDPKTGRQWVRGHNAKHWFQLGTEAVTPEYYELLFRTNVGRYKELRIPYVLEGKFWFDTDNVGDTRTKRKALVRKLAKIAPVKRPPPEKTLPPLSGGLGFNPKAQKAPAQTICLPWLCIGYNPRTQKISRARPIHTADWSRFAKTPLPRETWAVEARGTLGLLRELWLPYYIEGRFPFDAERELPVTDKARAAAQEAAAGAEEPPGEKIRQRIKVANTATLRRRLVR